ncbi:hypothetical protein AVEN_39888-1 [Araneus ventricosus]|uniref:Uncharacterized protein n=1 Tax=Araneus ventricosus TaxID=182803 RepID=A0A4Y2JQ92_ARAVE|nr:hypothetical protein AVEN_39888-1 [Araneus ventricosus]
MPLNVRDAGVQAERRRGVLHLALYNYLKCLSVCTPTGATLCGDSSTLRSQLQILIDEPENQKEFREMIGVGFVPSDCLNSDGRSARTDGSDRTERFFWRYVLLFYSLN